MGFFNRLANAWKIFTTSISFIGRDKSLLAVPILMVLSGVIFIIAAFMFAPVALLFDKPYFYLSVFLFFLVAEIVTVFLGAVQSWMVYEVAQNKDTTVASGFARALRNLPDIFAYAVVFFLISLLAGALRKRGRLGEIAAGFIETFAGIVGKLVLPAMIVTERSFGEAVAQMKHSTRAVPEILTYEIGIRPLTVLATILGVLLSIAFGLSFGFLVGIAFFVIFIIALILLSILIDTTYYTLLYLTLIERKHIPGLKLR
jgi:hypothetical protein